MHLRRVFEVLQDNRLYVKQSKCKFGCKSVDYLGHVISENGIAVDPKVDAISNWPLP